MAPGHTQGEGERDRKEKRSRQDKRMVWRFVVTYFVLMGHLSPLDGIGPAELGLDKLEQRLQQGTIQEIILATNPTVEGETTAHYISQMAAEYGISATRLAHGIPLGGELEYIDGGTLAHAFSGRMKMG